MKKETFDNEIWNYYMVLEEKFVNSMKYVEVSQNNYNTYSLDYVSQIQGICSEIDVVMKEICGFKQDDRKYIEDYYPRILSKFPNIINQEVLVIGKNLAIKPFEKWTKAHPSKSLFWWKKYNSVKHGRIGNLKHANLQSVLYSLSALFILERYWLKEISDTNGGIDIPNRNSEIFFLSNWTSKYIFGSDLLLEQTESGEPVIDGGKF